MISIIITTKNEENNIGNLLKSILTQESTHICNEIIIVDNFSNDKTKEISENFNDTRIKFYLVGGERSSQRNFGINSALSSYILYLDADMILPNNFLVDLKKSLLNLNDIKAFYIKERIIGNSFLSKTRNFERFYYEGTPIDCVRVFTKEAFIDVKGFDESLCGPEDWDFNLKINDKYQTKLLDIYINHNEAEKNIFKYLKSKLYYSQDFKKYKKKWPNHKFIQYQFSFLNRYLIIFFRSKKHTIFTFVNFFYYLIFLCYKFLVGIIYFYSKIK